MATATGSAELKQLTDAYNARVRDYNAEIAARLKGRRVRNKLQQI
jgi:hypothetical protein